MRALILLFILISNLHATQVCEFDAEIIIARIADDVAVDHKPFVFRRDLSQMGSNSDVMIRGGQKVNQDWAKVKNAIMSGRINIDTAQELYLAIKRQIGLEGYVRALSPRQLREVMDDGVVQRGDFFSNKGTGAHVGHGADMIYIRCKTPRCDDMLQASSTGSGTQNVQPIPLSELEFIAPDIRAALKEVGLDDAAILP